MIRLPPPRIRPAVVRPPAGQQPAWKNDLENFAAVHGSPVGARPRWLQNSLDQNHATVAPRIRPVVRPGFNRLRPAVVPAVVPPPVPAEVEEEHFPEQVVYFDDAEEQEAGEEEEEALPEQVVYFDESAAIQETQDPMEEDAHQQVDDPSWAPQQEEDSSNWASQQEAQWQMPAVQAAQWQQPSWQDGLDGEAAWGEQQDNAEEKYELPAALRSGLPRVVRPRLPPPQQWEVRRDEPPPEPASPPRSRKGNASQLRLQQLEPSEVERGMIVIYDGFRRAWVDQCYAELDEFWLCDEKTNMTIFKDEVEAVRYFAASEFVFTGEYTPLAKITREVVITQEIVETILQMPDWESRLEQSTGVPIRVDSSKQKVTIGEASPPKVKAALEVVNAQLSELDQQIWSTDAQVQEAPPAQVPEPKPKETPASPTRGPRKPGQDKDVALEPEGETLLSQVAALAPEALPPELTPQRRERRKRQPASESESEEPRRSRRRTANPNQEMFRLGFEAAMKQMEERRAAEATAKNEDKTKKPDASPKAKDLGPPEEFATRLREATAAARSSSVREGQGQSSGIKTPEEAFAANRNDSGTSGRGEAPGGENRTILDWAKNQAEFAHLPPLPANWIRVRRKSNNGLYYVNIRTGRSQFDMPDGWVKMRSRNNGGVYYFNPKTGVSQLQLPPDAAAAAAAGGQPQQTTAGAATPAPAAAAAAAPH